MGVQYIVEKSSDRRTWSSSGVEQVGTAVDLGGGMERVVYRTTAATSAGSTRVHPRSGKGKIICSIDKGKKLSIDFIKQWITKRSSC